MQTRADLRWLEMKESSRKSKRILKVQSSEKKEVDVSEDSYEECPPKEA